MSLVWLKCNIILYNRMDLLNCSTAINKIQIQKSLGEHSLHKNHKLMQANASYYLQNDCVWTDFVSVFY